MVVVPVTNPDVAMLLKLVMICNGTPPSDDELAAATVVSTATVLGLPFVTVTAVGNDTVASPANATGT